MSLVIKVAPIEGESLPGLIVRAAAANYYNRAFDVLVQAKLGKVRPEALPVHDRMSVAPDLANVLGIETQVLQRMFYPERAEPGFVEFFQAPLRNLYREVKGRRVSPRALKLSPHMRAIWQVRALSFDPQTREQLLSCCPVCQKSLGFRTTGGVVFCDYCRGTDEGPLEPSVDLRDFPQPIVETEDDEALGFVTQLIDPDPAVRAGFAPTLSAELAPFDRGKLFDLACSIASAIERNVGGASLATRRKDNGRVFNRPFAPSSLAEAGRALLDWPAGFFKICETRAGDMASRPGAWGVAKELGAIDQLRMDTPPNSPERALFTTAVENYLGNARLKGGLPRKARFRKGDLYIGAREIADTQNIAYRTVRKMMMHPEVYTVRYADTVYSPILLARFQADRLVSRWKDLVAESALAVRLGVPVATIRDFEAAGLLTRGTGVEAFAAGSEPHYRNSEFEFLFGFLLDEAPLGDRPPGWTTFNDAMLMFPAGHKPWLAMFEDIFEGRIRVMFHDEPKRRAALKAMSVSGAEARREQMIHRMTEVPSPNLERVTTGDAMLMLGITVYPVFTACAKAGLLPVDEKNAVSCADVMSFARRFIFPNEIAVRSKQTKGQLDAWFKQHGLSPVREFPVKGGRLFDRNEVEPLLEMR